MLGFLPTEQAVRIACFAGVFVVLVAWEFFAPRRVLHASKPQRWGSNLGLVFLNSLLLRFIAPLGAVGIAMFAESVGWGLFQYYDVPSWLAIFVSVILLDFAIYLQHVMFHAIPVLWRLHMVHHADLDFDVTTGLRFHTLEIMLSLGIKCTAIVLLGASPLAVLIFEVLLNATAMFNHSNVRIPLSLDRALRLVIVTPDMHRVHHSVIRREANSNFGFNLPWWDFLLGTYRSQPDSGHEGMTIGLSQFRDERVERLPWMLLLPFIGKLGSYPINRENGTAPSHEQESAPGMQADQFGENTLKDTPTPMRPMDDLADERDQ